MLIDLRNKDITGKEAERALGMSEITVNKNMVPFDDKSPFVTSGFRIGTPAITTRGITENEIPEIARLIDASLMAASDEVKLEKIKGEVGSLMSTLPLFAY
jgi:glycine hydroxymethyltransferase